MSMILGDSYSTKITLRMLHTATVVEVSNPAKLPQITNPGDYYFASMIRYGKADIEPEEGQINRFPIGKEKVKVIGYENDDISKLIIERAVDGDNALDFEEDDDFVFCISESLILYNLLSLVKEGSYITINMDDIKSPVINFNTSSFCVDNPCGFATTADLNTAVDLINSALTNINNELSNKQPNLTDLDGNSIPINTKVVTSDEITQMFNDMLTVDVQDAFGNHLYYALP